MSSALVTERLILSGMLDPRHPEYFEAARQGLRPEYFIGALERKVFQTIIEKTGEVASIPARFEIEKELMEHGIELEQISPIFDEAEKQQMDIIVPWDFQRWLDVLRRDYFGVKASEALNRGDIEEARNLLIEAEQAGEEKRFAISNLDQLISEAIQEGKLSLVPTGYPDVDKFLRWTRGRLLIIAGKTGCGKSALLLNILLSHAHKVPTGLISIEMDKRMLIERSLNQLGPEEVKALKDNLWMSCPDSIDLMGIERIIKGMIVRAPELEVIGIDFLQLIRERASMARHEEVSFIVRGIKGFAKKFNIAIALVSQLSRNIDQRGPKSKPTLSDLKESGDVEYAADAVLFIHRNMEETPKEGEFILAKNRQGETRLGTKVLFDGEKTLWKSKAIKGRHYDEETEAYSTQQDLGY